MSVSDRDIVRQLGRAGQAFFGRFQSLREVQRRSIPPILSGKDVLVCSATASGKTEAVFAPLISRIRSLPISQKRMTRILAVAPTKALVNDLKTRLDAPIFQLGWSCGRQTGDHREKFSVPEVLITTPESFDSMLVRDGSWTKTQLIGHLLSGVEAVFIDEAHLFDASPRGDQVSWLLGRLRRLRKYARLKGWVENDAIQVCGASATISGPHKLAEKFLGKNREVIYVSGNREMEIFCQNETGQWLQLGAFKVLEDIFNHILLADRYELHLIVRGIWNTIENYLDDGNRKVLVFVPTRALCDKLALAIADAIRCKRDMFVGAHHGSLEKNLREKAERAFMVSKDAILVATTTLEVGIDIGDVDVVALVGCPPGTAELLQRVGRSGRRKGCSRVLPIAENRFEARAFSSMLDTAYQGQLEPRPQARLWSVFVQQAASHIKQAGESGRQRADLMDLAHDVWPEVQDRSTADMILDFLIEKESFVEKRGRLFLGSNWSDRAETPGGGLHHNFESVAGGFPVIDAATGEILTHVERVPTGPTGIALAGQRWDIVSEAGEIILKSSRKNGNTETFYYPAKAAPTTKDFAEHVRRGLGFDTAEAPLLTLGNRTLWCHFGGSAYEVILLACFPHIKRASDFSGLAVTGFMSEEKIQDLLKNKEYLITLICNSADKLVSALSLGRYHCELPDEVKKMTAMAVFEADRFVKWLATRQITTLQLGDQRMDNLMSDLTLA